MIRPLFESFLQRMLWGDARVLALYTWASHLVQRWIGWTCYRQASVTLTIGIVLNFIDIADYWLPTLLPTRDTTAVGVVMGVLSWFYLTLMRHVCRRADRDFTAADSDVLPTSALMLREAFPRPVLMMVYLLCISLLPVFVVAIVTGEWVKALSVAGALSWPTAAYLWRVDPLRPGQTRVQELAEQIRAGLSSRSPMEHS